MPVTVTVNRPSDFDKHNAVSGRALCLSKLPERSSVIGVVGPTMTVHLHVG